MRTRLRPLLAAGALAVTLALVFGVGGAFSSTDDVEQLRKIQEAYGLIANQYVERVDSAQLAEDAIEGMLGGLDPHSIYISSEEMRSVRESFDATFDGIGIYFEFVEGAADRDTLVVLMPIAGGPSEEAGLEAGDRIVGIDDTTAVGFDTELVQRYLKGPKGTRVKVTVKRPGFREPLSFTITRDRIPLETVIATYMLDDDTGYIKLQRFARTSRDEVRAAIGELKRQGMERLVLDLRDNGGGLMDQAVFIADEFLEAGELSLYTEGRVPGSSRRYVATSGGSFEDGPLMVLVNENSASSSEIVAGAVQDHDRGLIVGRRSFGKGLVQQQFPLRDGSVMQMTVSRYYTPAGRLIQTPYTIGAGEEAYIVAKRELREAFEGLTPVGGEIVETSRLGGSLPDSLKFETAGGRTVYGGGGILPDFIVPFDTIPPAARTMYGKGLDNAFARELVATDGDALRARFDGPAAIARPGARLPDGTFERFLVFAERQGVETVDAVPVDSLRESVFVRDELPEARDLIETRIRAFVGRRLFGMDAFYPTVAAVDPVLTRLPELWDRAVSLAAAN